jgi:predicted nucleic acid-binding protein
MALPIIVPDASVLLKWVLTSEDEENRDRALELRERWLSGDCTLIVPSLWVFELGNIVGTKQPDLADELLQILIDYRLEEEPAFSFCLKALELMRRFGVTFYDASYHAVALNRGGVLVTADGNYCRKTSTVGHSMKLADFGS